MKADVSLKALTTVLALVASTEVKPLTNPDLWPGFNLTDQAARMTVRPWQRPEIPLPPSAPRSICAGSSLNGRCAASGVPSLNGISLEELVWSVPGAEWARKDAGGRNRS